MAEQRKDLRGTLRANRSLAIQVNARPAISHRLTVLKYLRLEEGYEPEGMSAREWVVVLDHWDNDASHQLQRGVFYQKGDVVEVDRFEAADLLTIVPSYLAPADDLTRALAERIAGGTP